MKKILIQFVLIFLYISNLYTQEGNRYVEDEVIIKFKSDILKPEFLESDTRIFSYNEAILPTAVPKDEFFDLFLKETKHIKKVFSLKPSTKPVKRKDSKIIDNPDLYNTVIFKLNNENQDILDLCDKLSNVEFIEYAEPNYIIDYYYPNDPEYWSQGSLQYIKLKNIWHKSDFYGSSDVRVGIIDSGIDYNHFDLGNGEYGTDNAKVVEGYDFSQYGVNDCIDTKGHGTNVAGIVAAYTNNNLGIAGIAGNSKLVGLKIEVEYQESTSAQVYDAIEMGSRDPFFCDIMNMSFGATYSWGSTSYTYAQALGIAVRRGVLLVGAKGNDGERTYTLPADGSTFGLSVGACDHELKRVDNDWWSSNYGWPMDILAPGSGDIKTTGINGKIESFSGTSAAAPHVAGVAALLLGLNPSLYAEDIHEIINRTAMKTPEMNGEDYTDEEGYGILNAESSYNFVKNGILMHEVHNSGQTLVDNTYDYKSTYINSSFNTRDYSNCSPGIHLYRYIRYRTVVPYPSEFSSIIAWGNRSGTGSASIFEPSYGDCIVTEIDETNHTITLETYIFQISTEDGYDLGWTHPMDGSNLEFGYTIFGFYDVNLQLSQTVINSPPEEYITELSISNIGESDIGFNYEIKTEKWIHVEKIPSSTSTQILRISVDENFSDIDRIGVVEIITDWDMESGNVITVNQAKSNYITDGLEPQIGVFDKSNILRYFDPATPYAINTHLPELSEIYIDIATVDYDQDGIDEIVSINYKPGIDNLIYHIYNYSTGEITNENVLDIYTNDFTECDVIDIDADGIDELLISSNNTIYLYNLHTGTRLSTYDISNENFQTEKYQMKAEDIDNDGNKELILCDGIRMNIYDIDLNSLEKIMSYYISYTIPHEFYRDFAVHNYDNQGFLEISVLFDMNLYDFNIGYEVPKSNIITIGLEGDLNNTGQLEYSILQVYTLANNQIDDQIIYSSSCKLVAGNFNKETIADELAILKYEDVFNSFNPPTITDTYPYELISIYDINSSKGNIDSDLPFVDLKNIPKLLAYKYNEIPVYYSKGLTGISSGKFYVPDFLKISGNIKKSGKYFAKKLIYSEENTNISPSVFVDLISGEKINLKSGFEAEKGCLLNVKIMEYEK